MPVSIVPVVGNGGDAHPGYRTAAPLRPALAHGGAWRLVRQQQLQLGVNRIGSGNLEACGGADRPATKRRPRLPEAVPAWTTWRCLAAVLIATGASMVFGKANAGNFYLRAGLGLDHPAETTFTERDGIVKLTDCRPFLAFLHEAKPLKLRRVAIDNLPRFRSESG